MGAKMDQKAKWQRWMIELYVLEKPEVSRSYNGFYNMFFKRS